MRAPRPDDRHRSSVVVIGGGVNGASIAYHLAARGVPVTVLEQSYWASGPTGRSSANVRLFYLTDELVELARRSQTAFHEFAEVTGGDAGFRHTGLIYAPTIDEAPLWRAQAERLAARGLAIEIHACADLAHLLPGFDLQDVETLIYEPGAGYADPVGATTGYLEAARRLGATLRSQARVRRLVAHGGRIDGVELADGSGIASDVVIVAAGPWTRGLIQPLGIDLPLHVERHPIAMIDAPGIARSVLPVIWSDNTHAYYARAEGPDVIIVGTQEPMPALASFEDFDESLRLDEVVDLVSRLARRAPAIADLGVRGGYASLYDVSPDSLPVVGAVPGIDGLVVSAGSSGTGFKLAPELGEQVARLVVGADADLLGPFRVGRPVRIDSLMRA